MNPTNPHELIVQPPDEHGIAHLRFASQRPMNVMSLALVDEMLAEVRALAARTDIRVLMLWGTPKAFSGGADLGAIGEMDPETYQRYIHTEFALFDAIEQLPFITVAVMVGPCLGNAAELVLGCDFRLAADTSVFGLAETRVGFQGPTQRITRYVGLGVAKDMLYRGLILTAAESFERGLVSRVCPAEEIVGTAATYALELAALPPVAIRVTKANVALAYESLASGTDREIASSLVCYDTEDFREGVVAFFAKRAPAFVGR